MINSIRLAELRSNKSLFLHKTAKNYRFKMGYKFSARYSDHIHIFFGPIGFSPEKLNFQK